MRSSPIWSISFSLLAASFVALSPAVAAAQSTPAVEVSREPHDSRTALVAGGAATLGFTYLGGILIAGAYGSADAPMFIPLAGPFLKIVTMESARRDRAQCLGETCPPSDGPPPVDGLSAIAYTALVLDGLLQIGAAGFMVWAALRPPPRAAAAQLHVVPGGPAGSPGLTVVGTF